MVLVAQLLVVVHHILAVLEDERPGSEGTDGAFPREKRRGPGHGEEDERHALSSATMASPMSAGGGGGDGAAVTVKEV